MPMAPSPEQASAIRESFAKAAPNSTSGIVTAVLSDQPFAMIGEIKADNIKPGDAISFVNADGTAIAHGVVVDVKEGKPAVRFEEGQRRPVVGDVAVKF
jgi:plastocyanin